MSAKSNMRWKSKAMFTLLGGAVLVNPAFSQQSAEEELVVTGIRASLQRSMDVKRDSSGVVDAITAEDIGKFPDSNLAESLQRITGVSIDRQNGEGFQVTVRGFGPSFNMVTLNGRSLPTSQLGATGGLVSNRAFDMSNIASEGVSGVEVYKTSKANISSGGIGSTINLQTRKPLDNPGLTLSVGAKALMDTTNRVGDDVTPELSGFLSWSDDDAKFGASFAASYQERHSAQTGAFNNWFNQFTGPWVDAETNLPNVVSNDSVTLINEPEQGTQTNATAGVRYIHGDYERTRTNGQLTLQYRPVEAITATLDFTYAEQESYVNRAETSFWFAGGAAFPTVAAQFDENPNVATPIYLWQDSGDNDTWDINFGSQQGNVTNTLESVGLNLEWQVNESLTLTLDAHDSKSKSLPSDGEIANWQNTSYGVKGSEEKGWDMSRDLPLIVHVYSDDYDPDGSLFGVVRDGGNTPGELDVGDLGSTVRQINYNRIWNDVSQVRIDGKWTFADEASIDFGIDSRSFESLARSSFDQTLLEGGWSVAMPGDIPPDMVEELDWNELFDGYSTSLTDEGEQFFNEYARSGTPTVLDVGYIADAAELGEFLAGQAGIPYAPNPNDNVLREIREDIHAIYTQLDISGTLGPMDVDVLAGIRYETTSVESDNLIAAPFLLWQGDDDFLGQAGSLDDAFTQSNEASYDHILPNLDIAVHITESLIGRFSLSKTIARASYNQLAEGVSGIGGPRGGPTILGGTPGAGNDGNTALKPVESDNIDISLEWYFADASYASVGFFDKRVPNFIASSPNLQAAVGVGDPSDGPRARAAIAELESRGLAVDQQNLFRMIASMHTGGPGCINQNPDDFQLCGADFDSETSYITWENNVDLVAIDGDPELLINAQIPTNSRDARLQGWEFAVQHFFGDSGFGAQANYTSVNGSVAFQVDEDPSITQFALTGLSDSANIALMYDNHGIQARIAYNWRDEFLDNATFVGNEPQFTEAYSQLDFNVGYQFNDNFSVALEGLNILEEDKRQFSRSGNQLTRLEILGARYALSARYTF
jgi:TonB-dependent receptor